MVDMPLAVRRAGPADADTVRDLSRKAYRHWVPVLDREPLPMTADYDRAVVEHRIELVEEDGKAVALIEFRPEPDHLLIVNIAVHPDLQGKGRGRQLLAHAETVARELGLTELRLYTSSLMEANLAFYRRHGYAEFARELRAPNWEIVHLLKRIG